MTKIDPFAKAKARNQAKSRKKLIEATEANIAEALKTEAALHTGDLFKYDLFAHQILVCRPIPLPWEQSGPWVSRQLTDIDITSLMIWFQSNGYLKVSSGRVQRAVEIEAQRNAFNPVQDALLALPAWDGTVRLDAFFRDVCGAEIAEDGLTDRQILNRDKYYAAVGRKFFIGLIARIMEPGCKNDTMVILEGEQGTFKSTLLRQICLEPRWFSDNMPHDVTNKDAKQHLRGHLIIEMSELNQMSKSRADAFKEFLTMVEDEYRPPYGRNPIIQPRACIFTGTTNQDTYLVDETGNRRIWPITCGTINLGLAALTKSQLYAEALAAYKAGEDWWLPEDIEMLAIAEQNQRITDDPWDDAVETVVKARRDVAVIQEKTAFYVSIIDALRAIQVKTENYTPEMQRRIRKILKKKGGDNRQLPRGEGWPKRAYRFVLGGKGYDFADTGGTYGTDKPLN